MQEALTAISNLGKKIPLLLARLKQAEEAIQAKDKTIAAQNNSLSELAKEKEILLQQNLLLKQSLGTLSTIDKKLLDQKLRNYIKYIDKTIAHLSE